MDDLFTYLMCLFVALIADSLETGADTRGW